MSYDLKELERLYEAGKSSIDARAELREQLQGNCLAILCDLKRLAALEKARDEMKKWNPHQQVCDDLWGRAAEIEKG